MPIVALETRGSACFSHAISINEGGWLRELPEDLASTTCDDEFNVKIAHLKELKSRASSLGATAASSGVIKKALGHPGGVICGTVPDEMAMDTCSSFAGNSISVLDTAKMLKLVSSRGPQNVGGARMFGNTHSSLCARIFLQVT